MHFVRGEMERKLILLSISDFLILLIGYAYWVPCAHELFIMPELLLLLLEICMDRKCGLA